MGTGALKLVGSSWSLGLNAETGVVVATIKPRCPGTTQKRLAVGQTGLHTAKAHGNRGLPGVCRCVKLPAAVQTWPGLWWSPATCQAARVWRKVSARGIAWPIRGGCIFLGPPSRAKHLPLEDWVALAHMGSAVPPTAQCFPLEGATWCCYQRRGLCEGVPCGSPKRRFNFSYEYCSVE